MFSFTPPRRLIFKPARTALFVYLMIHLLNSTAFAQGSFTLSGGSGATNFTASMQSYFSGLDLTQVPHSILFDYGLPLLDTRVFHGSALEPENLVYSHDVWKYGYGAMSLGQVNGNTTFQNHDQIFTAHKNHLDQDESYPLVVLLAKYSKIKENAIANNLIYELNEVLYDVPGRTESPYETHNVFMGSIAHSQDILSQVLPVEFQSEWFYSNVMGFESMLVDFGDGNGEIQVTDGFRRDIVYPDTGTYTITYKIQTSFGLLVAHSNIRIAQLAPVFDQAINLPGLQMQIDYACGRNKIMKPLIYVQGFEFVGIDNFTIETARATLDDNPQVFQMAENDYDLIFIKLDRPQDDIISNSHALKAAIHAINELKWQNGSNEPNLVIGESMGGLISRLALRSIEIDQQTNPSIKHDCSRLIVFDSPNQGANVPLSFQLMAREIGNTILSSFISPLENAVQALNSTAAKQMLIYHVDPAAEGIRSEFYAYLQQNGNPEHCVVVGISNGVDNATNQGFQPGTPFLDVNNTSTPLFWHSGCLGKIIGVVTYLWPIKLKGKLILNSSPNFSSVPFTIFESEMYIEFLWGLKKHYLIAPFAPQVTNMQPYDAAPGGFYPVSELNFFNSFAEHTLANRFGYIPTASGLNMPTQMSSPFLNFNGVNVSSTGNAWTNFNRIAREGSEPNQTISNRFHVTITQHNDDTIIAVMRDWRNTAAFLPGFVIASSTFNHGEDANGIKTNFRHSVSSTILNAGRLCVNCNTAVGTSSMTNASHASTESFGVSFERPCWDESGTMTIDVHQNGVFELGTNNSKFSKSSFNANTHLRIRAGGQLIINDGSQLSIEPGAKLTIEPGAIVLLNGTDAVLEISGELVMPANLTFQYAGNGYVRFNSPTITAGINAKFSFVGNGASDKIIEIAPNSGLFLPTNVAEFQLENGLVQMGSGAIVEIFTKVVIKNAVITGNHSALYNRFSISTKAGSVIQNTNFSYGTIGLRLGQQSSSIPLITGCTFSNNTTGLFVNTTTHSAQIKWSTFTNNHTSIRGDGLSLPVSIENCTIQSSQEGIRLQGWNMTQFDIKNTTIQAHSVGIRVFGGNLNIQDATIQGVATNNNSVGLLVEGNSVVRPRCVNINNFHVGADVGANCHLNLASSSNSNFINNTIGVAVDNGSLSVQNAASRLDANSLYSISGHLKPSPEFQRQVLNSTYLSFDFFKWPVHKLKLNAQAYPTLSASGSIITNTTSPLLTDDFTVVNGTITQINNAVQVPVFFDCHQCNLFFACETVSEPPYYSEWVLNPANGATGRMVNTTYFPGVEFIGAIRAALDDITFVPDQPVNDLQAVLKLKQLLSLNLANMTEEEHLAVLAASKYMGVALSNAYAYKQLNASNIQSPEPLSDEELFLIDLLEEQKSSADEPMVAELVIAQAQVYRLAGHYETAIQLINSPEATAALHNKQAYWSCLLPLEYDYLLGLIDDQVYLEQSSDCGNLWQMRRKSYPNSSNSENMKTNLQKEKLEVYPNPGNLEISLKIPSISTGDIAKLEISDNQGRIVMKQNYQSGQKIVTSDLPAGAYHITIVFANHKQNALWIKY